MTPTKQPYSTRNPSTGPSTSSGGASGYDLPRVAPAPSLDRAIADLVETIPALRCELAQTRAALRQAQDELAAARKALAVVVSKADNHPAVKAGYRDGTLVELYLPFSPGELDVMRGVVGCD